MVSMYLSIYLSMSVSFTLCLLHPGSRDLCTPWNAPSILVYWRVLTCVIYNCTPLNSNDNWSYSCLPWRLSTKTGRWMRRHIVQIDSAYWDSGAVAARQGLPTCLYKSEATDGLTVLLFCDVYIDIGSTLNLLYSACMLFVDVQTNSVETSLALLAM